MHHEKMILAWPRGIEATRSEIGELQDQRQKKSPRSETETAAFSIFRAAIKTPPSVSPREILEYAFSRNYRRPSIPEHVAIDRVARMVMVASLPCGEGDNIEKAWPSNRSTGGKSSYH
jgi:hypothetical protein